MTNHIDFLPDSYRQSKQLQQKQVWRRGVLAVFMGIVVLGGLGQQEMILRLKQRRNHVRSNVTRLTAQIESTDELQAKKAHLESVADLVTVLRVRVLPSSVLHTMIEQLPPYVSITRLRSEVKQKAPKPNAASVKASKSTDATDGPPYEIDLKALRERRALQNVSIQLKGIAPDDQSISLFLSRLLATGLFEDVTLLFTDRQTYRDDTIRSFEMSLRVKQPGSIGPLETPLGESHAGKSVGPVNALAQNAAPTSKVPQQ